MNVRGSLKGGAGFIDDDRLRPLLAIRFLFETGNIASAKYAVYGLT
jgi:hypothetical protein